MWKISKGDAIFFGIIGNYLVSLYFETFKRFDIKNAFILDTGLALNSRLYSSKSNMKTKTNIPEGI